MITNMAMPFLSVIIPSYNEIKNLKRGVLNELVDYLKSQNYTYEIILSDDGSTDGTAPALDTFAKKHDHVRVLHNQHAGKSPTVTAGMLEANGEWVLFSDFDQSTPISEVEKLFQYKETHSVIIGSREIAGARRDKEPWYRHLMGKGFNLVVQVLTVRGIKDTQCGFKLFKQETVRPLFGQLYVYSPKRRMRDAFTGAFDVEVLFLAQRQGFAIKEVPIHWKHAPTERVSPIKDSVRMFRDVLRIRVAAIRGKYGST